LLPDRNGTDSGGVDGRRGDELLHCCEFASVIELLVSIALLVRDLRLRDIPLYIPFHEPKWSQRRSVYNTRTDGPRRLRG
jgi:hypothetical protein